MTGKSRRDDREAEVTTDDQPRAGVTPAEYKRILRLVSMAGVSMFDMDEREALTWMYWMWEDCVTDTRTDWLGDEPDPEADYNPSVLPLLQAIARFVEAKVPDAEALVVDPDTLVLRRREP
jgi:hypothetical protein